MQLFEILKQFKRIEPDQAFKEKSKRAVLSYQPRQRVSLRRAIMGFFETGIALALTGFFILLITGRFSGSSYIAPVQFSVINPQTLHAEAQAVDIQIQLANLSYQESSSTTGNVSTPQIAAAIIAKQPALLLAQASSSATSTSASAATSTPTSTISVDQALQELSR
jgi:hypothetical protein